MKKKVVVLGAGLVGNAIAIDLKKSGYEVLAVDVNNEKLEKLEKNHGISILKEDFIRPGKINRIVRDADLVAGAVPGEIGFSVIREVIHAGRNMVDISFCPEDYMELDDEARKKGVCILTDIGVAPGMCNLILGYHDRRMEVHSYKCIVGGLPVKREWPLEYRASWSPMDVIEEYTRPARFRDKGKMVTKPALSDSELVNLEPVGTLEEWNSDGLRSLLQTMPHIPNLVEKTLRYPGTVNYLRVLQKLGFFSTGLVDAAGQKVRPVDVTAALLFPRWKLQEGEKEFTIMQVRIEGLEEGTRTLYVYDMYDKSDEETGTLSMARTTGYTCTAAAKLVLEGKVKDKGIIPPEFLGRDSDNFRFILNYLAERGVHYRMQKVSPD